MHSCFTMHDLRRLRLLRELRDRGTVGAVARALDYSPSAVSQQLRVLEGEAGVPLLERAGRRVRLTEAGEVLARHADKLLGGLEEAEAELAGLAEGGVVGTVRIAAFQTATIALIPPALTELEGKHPGLRVEILQSEPEPALQALALGDLDVVIADEWESVPRPGREGLLREELLSEGVRLILPADHPLANGAAVPLRALADAAWACGRPPSSHDRLVQHTCRTLGGFTPDVRHRSTDLLVLLALVRSGHAVTLLPDLVRAHDDPTLAVRDLAEGKLTRRVFTTVRATAADRPGIAAVRAALRAAAS